MFMIIIIMYYSSIVPIFLIFCSLIKKNDGKYKHILVSQLSIRESKLEKIII